jgi:excisionase family DNA binding protein
MREKRKKEEIIMVKKGKKKVCILEQVSCKNCENGYNSCAVGPRGASASLFNNLIWLTTAETALYLRKSKDAVRQMVCRGQLQARKFHRRLYFKKVELDQALDISFY